MLKIYPGLAVLPLPVNRTTPFVPVVPDPSPIKLPLIVKVVAPFVNAVVPVVLKITFPKVSAVPLFVVGNVV